jgi:hypothetical protein
VGKEKIIYASNSNENTYTELWTGNFFGFKHLIGSLKRTAVPILLKPANVYYHIYSGEREASLHALKSNLDYIRTLSITPVAASHYIEIANGFYSGELEELAHNKWKVSNRKRLQTVRFDRASSRAINWQEAKGVIGQRYLHGALYVYLDEAVEEPIIALYDHKVVGSYPEGPCPYLVDSRWPVWNLQRDGGKLTFSTGGYGLGEQHWRIPEGSSITVSKGKVNTENSIATLTIDGTAPAEVLSVTLQWEVGGSSSRPTEE